MEGAKATMHSSCFLLLPTGSWCPSDALPYGVPRVLAPFRASAAVCKPCLLIAARPQRLQHYFLKRWRTMYDVACLANRLAIMESEGCWCETPSGLSPTRFRRRRLEAFHSAIRALQPHPIPFPPVPSSSLPPSFRHLIFFNAASCAEFSDLSDLTTAPIGTFLSFQYPHSPIVNRVSCTPPSSISLYSLRILTRALRHGDIATFIQDETL